MNIENLMSFIDKSPSSYHVVKHMVEMANGFTKLNQEDAWHLKEGEAYYVVNDDGAILFFQLGSTDADVMAFRTVLSHTDSPALRLLPDGIKEGKDCVICDVEPYGAIIRASWLDRPLSLAGRVLASCEEGIKSIPVDFKEPIATIPNLAPHLNRGINTGHVYELGKDLRPICPSHWKGDGFKSALSALAGVESDAILDVDLYFYPIEKGVRIGEGGLWLSAPRLDNLATAYPALEALLNAKASDVTQIVYIADNEEVGSLTQSGGDSTFLANILKRIAKDDEAFYRALSRSFLMSCDMAHADHPNYPEFSNSSASPILGGGVAIKVAASRSYATHGASAARFKRLMKHCGLQVQYFANPHGQRGGSTIGPLSVRHLDVEAIDIGIPTWAMHSAREVVHVQDVLDFYNAMQAFFDVAVF